jgi:hypothetical protein
MTKTKILQASKPILNKSRMTPNKLLELTGYPSCFLQFAPLTAKNTPAYACSSTRC